MVIRTSQAIDGNVFHTHKSCPCKFHTQRWNKVSWKQHADAVEHPKTQPCLAVTHIPPPLKAYRMISARIQEPFSFVLVTLAATCRRSVPSSPAQASEEKNPMSGVSKMKSWGWGGGGGLWCFVKIQIRGRVPHTSGPQVISNPVLMG